MDIEPAKRVNGRMWQPGQSGNPLGRPIGARGRFSQQFIEDMRASWEKHGATVMDRVAVEYPDRYLGIAAHLIPKEVEATITAGHTGLDGSDLALLKACKAEIEGVESMSPQQVFEIVRETLRTAQAKQIDCPIRTVSLSRARKYGHLPNQVAISPIIIFRTVGFRGRIKHA